MTQIEVPLEDELLTLLRQFNEAAPQAAREFIILELYRRGEISSGKGAQLLNMPKREFIQHTSRLGIPYFDMTAEEWEAERKKAEQI